MSWFKIDDSLPDHPKVEKLEHDHRTHQRALAAWTVLGASCARRGNGGIVSRELLAKALSSWPARERELAAEALIAVGLWEPVDGGWRFHDWTVYQPSAQEERESRAAKNARQQRWREKRRQDRLHVDADVDGLHVDARGAEVGASQRLPVASGARSASRAGAGARGPVPTRPVPSPLSQARESAASTPAATALEGHAARELLDFEALRAELASAWKSHTSAVPRELVALAPSHEVVTQLIGLPRGDELQGLLRRFFADEAMRRKGWPISWFLRNPAQWHERAGGSANGGGHAAPKPASEYVSRDISFDDLMRKPTTTTTDDDEDPDANR